MFNNGLNGFYPYQNYGYKPGLFSSFRGKFNWSGILNNTQKTLNIINQAIPVFYQIKPIWNNTKTVFKIIGAIKEDDKGEKVKNTNRGNNTMHTSSNNNNYQNNFSNYHIDKDDNRPNFFL